MEKDVFDKLVNYYVNLSLNNPFDFVKVKLPDMSSEEQLELEKRIVRKNSNIIVTHSDVTIISKDEIKSQLDKMEEIYSNGEIPYFIDFPSIKDNKTRKLKK